MPAKKNHPGSITARGNGFRIVLCVAGKYHRFQVTTDDREVAEAEARKQYDDLKKRTAIGLPGPMPFSELLTRFEDARLPSLAAGTQRGYLMSLEGFRAYFVTQGRDLDAHAIRPGHVEDFLQWRRWHQTAVTKRVDGSRVVSVKRKESALMAKSLARERTILHNVFAFGETLEVVTSNPVRKTKPPKGDSREPVILSGDQYERLIAACGSERPFLKLFVIMLGETGVRCESEALWTRWEDVDLEKGLLTVESVRKGRRTKSGKSRRVPITTRLREALRDHMAMYRLRTYGEKSERSQWIFHHELAKRNAKSGERITSLRRSFAAAAKRAQLPADLNQHDLRHRRVTTWLQEGQPIHLVQRAMGHSTVRVTEGYMHLVDEDLLSLVDAPRQRTEVLAG